MHDVLRERVERLACDFDFRDNYFAWQAFAGRYAGAPDATPAIAATSAAHRGLVNCLGRSGMRVTSSRLQT